MTKTDTAKVELEKNGLILNQFREKNILHSFSCVPPQNTKATVDISPKVQGYNHNHPPQ
ncbi:MAG: hypothetical protein F6K24_18925 [Okeania sp. SIO2D1]|nr:hypothetical protein [Okeania sp. SIO2D1]